MARQKVKPSHEPTPEEPSKPRRRAMSDTGLILKLVVMLVVVTTVVILGAYFHEQQNAEPLGYEYFKKRGYDKIPELEPNPEPVNEQEEARIKAQRNIFLQD